MKPHIYLIVNLINGKTYVGKSMGHRRNYFTGGLLIKRAIRKYGRSNFSKSIIVQGDFNDHLLNELEKHYIWLFSNPKSKTSYNIVFGGQGIRGLKHTSETIRKISQAAKISSNRPSFKEMLSRQNYWSGKKRPEIGELLKKVNSKKVYQFDLDGNFIKEWSSIAEASRHFKLKTPSPISNAASPKSRKISSCGYLWSLSPTLIAKKRVYKSYARK